MFNSVADLSQVDGSNIILKHNNVAEKFRQKIIREKRKREAEEAAQKKREEEEAEKNKADGGDGSEEEEDHLISKKNDVDEKTSDTKPDIFSLTEAIDDDFEYDETAEIKPRKIKYYYVVDDDEEDVAKEKLRKYCEFTPVVADFQRHCFTVNCFAIYNGMLSSFFFLAIFLFDRIPFNTLARTSPFVIIRS